MEASKKLAQENGNQASMLLGELTGDELLVQNGNQAGFAMGELTDDELLAQNGNQAGVGVAEYFDELDKRPKILTFTANEDGSSVGFIVNDRGYEPPEDYSKPSLQYSTDGGKTWQDYDLQISDAIDDATTVALDKGESVMFKGVNENLAYYLEDEGDWLVTRCCIEGNVAASGDVTSLLNGVGGDIIIPSGCYQSMFEGCTGLTQAPTLPATTLADNCYSGMFYGCTGLTSAPVLPATTLASSCYTNMFNGCTNITSHDVATLNNSLGIFANNSSCVSLAIHAKTPPTIASTTITGLKADCAIYVPAASVDAYKAAQYWSARASYIQAMP